MIGAVCTCIDLWELPLPGSIAVGVCSYSDGGGGGVDDDDNDDKEEGDVGIGKSSLARRCRGVFDFTAE